MTNHESSHSLAKPTVKIAAGTLLSRVLGFVRDLLIARLFGADQATDAFFVAFRIPNLMRRLFAEGAFATALVPALSGARFKGESIDTTRMLVAELAGSLSALLLLVSIVGIVFAPVLVLVLAPGFSADAHQQDLTVSLIRLTLPYLVLIGLTALAGAVLNSFDHFSIPAVTPALLNVSLIGCALTLAPRLQQPMIALAIGVLIGGVAQLALQLPALARLHLLALPRIRWANPALRRFLTGLGPTLIGLSVTQLNLLLGTLLASLLAAGSISWLYYAERLMDFPLGILGAALGTAILPRLARTHAVGDRRSHAAVLDWALRWVALLGVPAAAGLFVLAEPIIATLFFSDHFGVHDVRMAHWSLMAYALGLPFFLAMKIIAPGFFSRGDLKTPMRIGLLTIAVNVALSLFLMPIAGHSGLAIATALAAAVGTWMFVRKLLLLDHATLLPGWTSFMMRVTLSAFIMAILLSLAMPRGSWSVEQSASHPAITLAGLILVGAIGYLLSLLALGLRPSQLTLGS